MRQNKQIKSSLLAIVLVISLFIPTFMALAITDNQVAVSTDAMYEDSATVWGKYIGWERGIDLDSSGAIDNDEPAWIMVTDITTDKTFPITTVYEAGVYRTGSQYYQARNPKIYGHKMVYLDMVGTAQNQYTLMMYDFITNTSTEVNYADQLPSLDGKLATVIDFNGDWIALSSYGTTHRQLYLYNYEENIARVIIPTTETNINVITVNIYDDLVAYTKYNTVTMEYWIGIYNITSGRNAIIELPITFNSATADSIYENYVGISFVDSSEGDGAYFDINGIDWVSGSWTGNPTSHTFTWTSLTDNITVFDDSTLYDTTNVKIWGNYIAYNNYITANDMNVVIYNIEDNVSTNLTDNTFRQVVTDIYDDKILWNTNENSLVFAIDTTANFDIYRTQTELENLSQQIIDMTPFIIGLLFVGFVLGAFVLFGRDGIDY